jgi:hypothetical protein
MRVLQARERLGAGPEQDALDTMEISSFIRFRPTRRQLVLVATLAVVAAVAAAYLTYRKPAIYTGSAVVYSARVLPPGTPDYTLRPWAADLQTTVTEPDVVSTTAHNTGRSVSDVSGGLTAGLIGDSSTNVQVTFTSSDRSAASAVAAAAARAAAAHLANVDLERAQRTAKQTQKDYDTANQAVATYNARNGTAASAQRDALNADVDRAAKALADALDQVDSTKLEVLAADATTTVAAGSPSRKSKIPEVTQSALTAAIIVMILGFLTLLVRDWRRPRIRWAPPRPQELSR